MRQDRYSRRAWLQASTALGAVLALAACGSAAVNAANAAASPAVTATTTSSAESTRQSVLTASPRVAAASTASSAQASTATTSVAVSTTTGSATSATLAAGASAATSPAGASAVKLTLEATGTQANYQVQEQLAGHNFPSQAIGRTSAVTGAIVIDANGAIVPSQSKIEVDLRTLKSDQGMRDAYIQRSTLQTSEYPTAIFVPSKATGLPWPLPATGTAKLSLAGNLTVHGTTQPTTWAVSATFAGNQVTGTASTPFKFTDFGMTPPRTAIALSVEDHGTLELQFTATRTTG